MTSKKLPSGTVILMDLYFSHQGSEEAAAHFKIGILVKLKSLGLESRTLEECFKFAMGCEWVQLLKYLLSLIMPSLVFTPYEPSKYLSFMPLL